MNEKIHIRRTTAPVKTPRITAQSSNGYISPSQHIAFVSQQKNVLPILPSSFDTSKIISINHSFHLFTDNISYFLSHNGCIGSYRTQVSQNLTELERLFNSFYQAILKYSSQKNCQANPTIRSTGISFLKNWQLFALSILELRRAGPGMIIQSINAHFNSINSSLKTVMNNGISKSNVHDQSYKNGRVLQNQLNLLKSSSNSFLERSNNSDELKKLSSEMKEFSRLLNETFAREFTQCGIAQNEVVRLRSKCYTACSDVIHGLKNSYVFQKNINKLLQLLVGFQDNLRELLEKLNLPTNYLISMDLEFSSISDNQNIDDDNNEEEEIDIEISFDENLPLPEFIRDSQERSSSFIRNQQSGDRFFGILNTKVTDLLSEMSKRKNVETNQQKLAKDECEKLKRENKLLVQERKVFMDEADDLKVECENLKESINQMKCDMKISEKKLFDNSEKFRNAFKEISKINEEIDDDSLISQTLKMHTDMIIRYQILEEREQKLKKILNTEDILSEAERLLNEVSQANSKMNQEIDSISEFKEKEKKLKEIFNQFSKLDSPIDVANEISDSFKKLKHIVNCNSLSESVDSIFLTFSDIKESLFRMSNLPKNKKNDENLLVLANNVENEIVSAQKIMKVALNDESSNFSLSKMAEMMSSIQSRYLNGFKSILTILGQESNTDDVDLVAIKSIQKVHMASDKIIQKLKQFSEIPENFQGDQSELVSVLLNGIERKIGRDKENIGELQKLCIEVNAVLSNYVNNEVQPTSTASKQASLARSIRALLKKLPQKENSQKSRNESETKLFLKKIELNLCKVTNDECQDDKNRQDHIMIMINKINDFVTSLHSKFGIFNKNFDDFLNEIEKVSSNSKSDKKVEEIDKMFESVFDLVPVTSRTEPSHYIPEFCNAFISLHNSVLSLKPFASILNQIFSQFDCKLQSFKPSSRSFQFIKGQIFNLHTALNSLSPSKVNSLVFLILSRFVALTSSFTAAISSALFDDGDPNMKETFFQMQLQLCKNEKMI